MIKMISAKVRCEGDVNQDWEITYENGLVKEYYACEESPRFKETDIMVHTVDHLLSERLCDISCLCDGVDGFEPSENDCIEFEVDFVNNIVHNIVIHKCDENGEYPEEDYIRPDFNLQF